ncbi:MAG: hypothetical protein Q4B78_01980 [Bacillota bacterium]|nr:hypothetical protein [Bacillota bacterium]
MEYRKKLLKMIDDFNVDSVEEFKEAENRIVADSKFRQITKKKDYDGHVKMLRTVKAKAQKIEPNTIVIPPEDAEATELRKAFERCLVIFSGVCDSYIQLQTTLKEKSEGVKIKFGTYKEFNNKVRFARASMNEIMHQMDVLYADLLESIEDSRELKEEELGGVKYRTYDSFQ